MVVDEGPVKVLGFGSSYLALVYCCSRIKKGTCSAMGRMKGMVGSVGRDSKEKM